VRDCNQRAFVARMRASACAGSIDGSNAIGTIPACAPGSVYVSRSTRQSGICDGRHQWVCAVFNVETTIAGVFRERIQRGAFAAAIRHGDIRGAFNHSADHVLGRTTSGTLRLEEDDKGLRYSITGN
jgi:hypothetical protein